MMPVIYAIRCKKNKKFYVGSARNWTTRKSSHLKMLRENNHHSLHLQRSFNKHGENNFYFEILENVEDICWIEKILFRRKKKHNRRR